MLRTNKNNIEMVLRLKGAITFSNFVTEICMRSSTGLVQSKLGLEFGFFIGLVLCLLFVQLYLLELTLIPLVGRIFLPTNTTTPSKHLRFTVVICHAFVEIFVPPYITTNNTDELVELVVNSKPITFNTTDSDEIMHYSCQFKYKKIYKSVGVLFSRMYRF